MPKRRRRPLEPIAAPPADSDPDLSPYLRRIPEFTTSELYWIDSRRKVPRQVQRRIASKIARIKSAIRRERARYEASGHGPIYVEPPATP